MKRARGNLDVICDGLAAVWSTQGREFVTFEVEGPGGPDADHWIQFLDGELNVRWPVHEEPATALASRGIALPRTAFAKWHVAGRNAAFDTGDAPLGEVARFVEALFERIVAGQSSFRVIARVERHA